MVMISNNDRASIPALPEQHTTAFKEQTDKLFIPGREQRPLLICFDRKDCGGLDLMIVEQGDLVHISISLLNTNTTHFSLGSWHLHSDRQSRLSQKGRSQGGLQTWHRRGGGGGRSGDRFYIRHV